MDMSWSHYLNLEVMSLRIVSNHLEKMTDENYDGEYGFVDNDAFLNNFENGFVSITMLGCYIESYLNTILNSCMNYQDRDKRLLKLNLEDKLELIFLYYNKDFSVIKSRNEWQVFKETTRVRNELIHFKKSYINEGTVTPPIKIGGKNIIDFFTKKNITNCRNKIESLAKLIAKTLDLEINSDVCVLMADGKDGLVNYVYDPKLF